MHQDIAVLNVTDKPQWNQICNGGVWFVQHKCKGPTSLFPQRIWTLWDRLCFSAKGEKARYTFPSTRQGKWRQSKSIHSKDGNINPYGCVPGEGQQTLSPLDMHAKRGCQYLICPGCENKTSSFFLFLLSVFAWYKFRASVAACERRFWTGPSKQLSTVMCWWWKHGDCVFPAVFNWSS